MSALPILTILNDPDRAAMYRHLAGQAGVPTIEAEGALHALTQLERMPVAAIICDAQMEDMSGEDFREVIFAEESTHDVPVYVLPPAPEAGTRNRTVEALPTSPQVLGEVLLTNWGCPPPSSRCRCGRALRRTCTATSRSSACPNS
ncbi:response regulator (plasmid) [Deinococcus sp. PESE-38]